MATVTYTEGGGAGWVRGQKKHCVPKINLQFRAPLINFIFPSEKFSDVGMWVGGSDWSLGCHPSVSGKPWPDPGKPGEGFQTTNTPP